MDISCHKNMSSKTFAAQKLLTFLWQKISAYSMLTVLKYLMIGHFSTYLATNALNNLAQVIVDKCTGRPESLMVAYVQKDFFLQHGPFFIVNKRKLSQNYHQILLLSIWWFPAFFFNFTTKYDKFNKTGHLNV